MAAITLKEDDELAYVSLIKDEDIIIATHNGMCIRFSSMEIGATSRATSGVKGINLAEGDYVTAATPVRDATDMIALVTKSGLGKRLALSELPIQKRAGKGLAVAKLDEGNHLSAAALVSPDDTVLIVGNLTSVCISAKDIPSLGRASSGNQLIKGSQIKSVSKV
jgi:DNA gyrase subunit A